MITEHRIIMITTIIKLVRLYIHISSATGRIAYCKYSFFALPSLDLSGLSSCYFLVGIRLLMTELMRSTSEEYIAASSIHRYFNSEVFLSISCTYLPGTS